MASRLKVNSVPGQVLHSNQSEHCAFFISKSRGRILFLTCKGKRKNRTGQVAAHILDPPWRQHFYACSFVCSSLANFLPWFLHPFAGRCWLILPSFPKFCLQSILLWPFLKEHVTNCWKNSLLWYEAGAPRHSTNQPPPGSLSHLGWVVESDCTYQVGGNVYFLWKIVECFIVAFDQWQELATTRKWSTKLGWKTIVAVVPCFDDVILVPEKKSLALTLPMCWS